MVRMSDLVRTGGRLPPPDPASPEPAPPPAEPAAARPREPEPAPTPVAPPLPPAPATPAYDPALAQADAAAAEQIFLALIRFLESVRDRMRAGSAALSWAELEQRIASALEAIERSAELFWVANRAAVPAGVDYIALHQARVAVLAMRVGATVGLGRAQLNELGMAGALMDIGLWRLPPGLSGRLEALGAEEQGQYRAHPRVAADLLRHWAVPSDGLVEMVLHHHEREQGQGFPQGLSGVAIHPQAKIRLNTGETGCVIAVNRNHPLRPRVEVYDARGRRLAAPKILDLAESPFLYITGPVAEPERR